MVLLLLVVLLAGVGIAIATWHLQVPRVEAVGTAEMDSFLAGLKDNKPDRWQTTYSRPKSIPKILSDFDPNTADSATFRRLGLPAFIAHNILSYRAKGGVFRTPEAFSKIYGLRPEQFAELRPYIFISEQFQKKENILPMESRKDSATYVEKFAEGTVIDLNAADTAQLKRVPGIGSGIARRIVAYRERLGGFHSVEQLKETGYVGEDGFRWFTVQTPIYRKIEVNRDGLDRLKAHPYMDFYKAKAICEYRRKRGKIKSLSQLALFEEFTKRDLDKLAPYLSFN